MGLANGESLAPGTHARTFVSDIDGTEQPYNLFVPEAAAKGSALPLAVVLHGYGATWESWFTATEVREWAEREGYYVLAPQGRGNWFYRGKGEKDVFEAMEHAKSAIHVDEDRIYLIGHSMGGWGTWFLGSAHPDVWAGIVPMAGWAPRELLPNLEYLAPAVFHGDEDPAVEVFYSRQAVSALGRIGISHLYHEERGAGHESSWINKWLPIAGEQLRGRTRQTAPEKIHLRAWTPSRGKAWWLRIHEIEPGKRLVSTGNNEAKEQLMLEMGSLDAQWHSQGRLAIETGGSEYFSIDFSQPPLNEYTGENIIIDIDGQNHTLKSSDWNEKAIRFSWEDRLPAEKTLKRGMGPGMRGTPIWMPKVVDAESLEPPQSPVIGVVVTPRDKMLERIGEIVSGNQAGRVVLLSETSFLPELEQGDLSLDELLDFYARSDDGWNYFHVSANELKDLLENQEEWKPSWWQDAIASPKPDLSDPGSSFTLMVPIPLSKKLGDYLPAEASRVQVMWRPGLRSILYSHVMKTGDL